MATLPAPQRLIQHTSVARSPLQSTAGAASAVQRDPDALSVDRLLAQSEDHYRAQRRPEAEEGFREVVRRDPFALHAWFRLGNLSHARHDLDGAAQAYRKAIELKPRHPLEQDAREKSLANLAIIGLEQARIALERLGERKNSTDARDRAGALAPVFEQRQAALQEEIARLAPRPTAQARVDALGLAMSSSAVPTRSASAPADRVGRVLEMQTASTGGSAVPSVRVESFLPGESALSGPRAAGVSASDDRIR